MQKVTNSACEGCELNQASNLKKLGINVENNNYIVALAGNPNTGNITVFNALTGLKQHTGNFPGYNDKKYKLVDLPGTYSLLSTSQDEEVARNFILFGKPDVTIIVVDASRLERNLNLVLQILEITDKAVLCLNLMDEAERLEIEIDDRTLARELGIPVVPTSARSKEGISELLKTVHQVATGEIKCKPHRIKNVPKNINNAIEKLRFEIEKAYPNIPNSRWIALRLLDGDQRIIEAVKTGEFISE